MSPHPAPDFTTSPGQSTCRLVQRQLPFNDSTSLATPFIAHNWRKCYYSRWPQGNWWVHGIIEHGKSSFFFWWCSSEVPEAVSPGGDAWTFPAQGSHGEALHRERLSIPYKTHPQFHTSFSLSPETPFRSVKCESSYMVFELCIIIENCPCLRSVELHITLRLYFSDTNPETITNYGKILTKIKVSYLSLRSTSYSWLTLLLLTVIVPPPPLCRN